MYALNTHNLTLVPSLAESCLRKLKEAVRERLDHGLAFSEFSVALPASGPTQWLTEVEAWEEDGTKPNPFVSTLPGTFVRSSTPYPSLTQRHF